MPGRNGGGTNSAHADRKLRAIQGKRQVPRIDENTTQSRKRRRQQANIFATIMALDGDFTEVPVEPLIYANLAMPTSKARAPLGDRTNEQVGSEFDQILALADSGANMTFCSAAFARDFGLQFQGQKRVVKMGKGRTRTLGMALIRGAILEGNPVKPFYMHIVEGLTKPVILGLDVFANNGIVIDPANRRVAFKESRTDAQGATLSIFEKQGALYVHDGDSVRPYGGEDDEIELFQIDAITLKEILKSGLDEDDDEEQEKAVAPVGPATPVCSDPRMNEIVKKYPDVFSPMDGIPPSRGIYDFKIVLRPGAEPVRRSYYRMSLAERRALLAELEKKGALNWIEPSLSPWSSPVLFARNRRKDQSLRPVYDFRSVNAVTQPFSGPIPRISDCLQRLHGCRYKTALDLSKAFNQVRNDKSAVELTAFGTPWGHFQSNVMMLGMANAGNHMQSLMEAVCRGDPRALPSYPKDHPKFDAAEEAKSRYAHGDKQPKAIMESLHSIMLVYIDDIIVYSKTLEQHYEDVDKVLARLDLFGFKLNQFSEFGVSEIDFLGWRVGTNTVSVRESRAQAIEDWPAPKNVAELRQFIGLCSFYRDAIVSYSRHTARLTPLVRKGATWVWDESHETAFKAIKAAVAKRVKLMIIDPEKPIVLATDASCYAIGAAMLQQDDTGKLRVAAYMSKQCSGAVARYSQHSLEMYAIVEACMHFRWAIDGCHDLTIYTDCAALANGRIFEQSATTYTTHRMARWIGKIAHIRATLLHHPASDKLAIHVDHVSRRPDFVTATTKDMEKWLEEVKAVHQRKSQGSEDTQGATFVLDTIEDGEVLIHANPSILERIAIGLRGISEEVLTHAGATPDQDGIWRMHGRILVPQDAGIRHDIIKANHEPTHPGIRATVRMIRRRFYWNRMTDDVKKYISKCRTCATTKPGNWKTRISHPLPLATDLWSDVMIDFLPALPESEGMTRICAVICRRSKELIVFACRDTITAEEFGELYLRYVYAYKGAPKIIRTDCDPLFISKAWSKMADMLKANAMLSLAYRHEQQGQVERANRSIEQMLRAYIGKDEAGWASALPAIQMAYNSTPLDGMGISTYEISMGWIPRRGAIDEAAPCQTHSGTSADRYAEIQKFVTEKLLEMQDRATEVGREWKPNVGDRVYLRTDELGAKIKATLGPSDNRLCARWCGPYIVIAHDVNSEGVHVELPLKWKVRQPIAISRLKPCDDDEYERPEILIDDEGNPYVEYEVEKVVGSTCKGRGKKKRIVTVAIRFVGFGEEFDRVYEDGELDELIDTAPVVLREHARETNGTFGRERDEKIKTNCDAFERGELE